METLAQRTAQARKARGLSQEQLAKASGMRQPDISKIERGLILSTTGIGRIADVLGVTTAWLERGEGGADFLIREADGTYTVVEVKRHESRDHPTGNVVRRGLDHDVSHASPTVTLTTIEWEDLMTAELPPTFQLVVRDDAMAPFLNAGDTARFSREKQPTPGKRVLIADRDGHHYIREYKLRRGDHWQAVALNPHYDPLDSVEDGLRVVAVLTGADWQ